MWCEWSLFRLVDRSWMIFSLICWAYTETLLKDGSSVTLEYASSSVKCLSTFEILNRLQMIVFIFEWLRINQSTTSESAPLKHGSIHTVLNIAWRIIQLVVIVRTHRVMILPRPVCFGHPILMYRFVVGEGRIHLGDSWGHIEWEWGTVRRIQDTVHEAFAVDDLLEKRVLWTHWVAAEHS